MKANISFTFAALNIQPKQLKLYTKRQIPAVLNAYLDKQNGVDPLPLMAAASVLPMRANNYVVEELIDWNDIPNDPIFQLTFPQPGEYFLSYTEITRIEEMNYQTLIKYCFAQETCGLLYFAF